ncbi:hypothetical protein Tco_0021553 [Tanacetum coccineum]
MKLLTNALHSYQLPVIPFPPSVTDSDALRPSSFSDQIVGNLPDVEQLILMIQEAVCTSLRGLAVAEWGTL